MVEDNSKQSVWNFDDERLKDLNYRMILCENALEGWDMEEINTMLHSVKRVVSGVLDEKEWTAIKTDFEELENAKRFMDNKNEDHQKRVIEFYNKADNVYTNLNRLMKDHGLQFREREEEDDGL